MDQPTDRPTDRQSDLYYPQFADKKNLFKKLKTTETSPLQKTRPLLRYYAIINRIFMVYPQPLYVIDKYEKLIMNGNSGEIIFC